MDFEILKRQCLEALEKGQNVLITGEFNCGKTTLFNLITSELESLNVIRSYKRGDEVIIDDGLVQSVIGRRAEDKMAVAPDGFVASADRIEQWLTSDAEYLGIDEIGFLECEESIYLDRIIEFSQKKTVLLVLRKHGHALEDRLHLFGDYLWVDLDETLDI